MSRTRALIAGASVFAAGVVAGYIFITKSEAGKKITTHVKQVARSSHEQVQVMSEEVALKTARVTRNPKITQDYAANQWESIGY